MVFFPTGEVMRQAINCVGLGNTSICFVLLNFLHEIHQGFLEVHALNMYTGSREMGMKTRVLQQSLKKVSISTVLDQRFPTSLESAAVFVTASLKKEKDRLLSD